MVIVLVLLYYSEVLLVTAGLCKMYPRAACMFVICKIHHALHRPKGKL